jgi:hypothetical protein
VSFSTRWFHQVSSHSNYLAATGFSCTKRRMDGCDDARFQMDSDVEAYVGPGRIGPADGSTKRVDYGGEPKTRRIGSPGQPKRRTTLKSTPMHEDRCCTS